MGNGSSQSIVLGPPRMKEPRHGFQYHRGLPPKYAHPQNRVLPKPIAGQRLRSTDNGSILQAAGTIRGLRRDDADALRKRSEARAAGPRLFHSDPDLARTRPSFHPQQDVIQDVHGQRRSYGGAALRASKLKYKKKTRAPDPPPNGGDSPGSRDFLKGINKTRAPQPPPPPPPMPTTTRTNVGSPRSKTQQLSDTTRAVETSELPKGSYEKNVHPLEKWRNHRSLGDVRIDEEEESRPGSRTTVFDSKKVVNERAQKPSHLPQRPDPFQKEIQAVTKKIAESRNFTNCETSRVEKVVCTSSSIDDKFSPKQYYFADAAAFKPKSGESRIDTKVAILSEKLTGKPFDRNRTSSDDKTKECTTIDEIVPSLHRFSSDRKQVKLPNRTPSRKEKIEREWEALSKNLCRKQEEESDIDIRLRPVLPRKTPQISKFSPTEVWQALGSEGLCSSNHSTSDESVQRYRKALRHATANHFNSKERRDRFKLRGESDRHWTPRQDLIDDSDVSSVDSEEAVVPRIRPDSSGISTMFSLPTVMFSNMRPIGHGKFPPCADKRVQVPKANPIPESAPSHFRRFLSKRNTCLSEEDVAVSDSNWTFGQYGLQKRGKQYSSELILSDKKKHELMRNNNDFLSDILMNRADRTQNKARFSVPDKSNFSFYSTEGVMYLPDRGAFMRGSEFRGPGVRELGRKFESGVQKSIFLSRNKKKSTSVDMNLGRKRDLELVRMLEDEVRRRRNREKITLRQQLQRMKGLHSEDEGDDFDDEAYFTEPKSREDPRFPFYEAGPSRGHAGSAMNLRYGPVVPEMYPSHSAVTTSDSTHLSHWQSSPAILEDAVAKRNYRPTNKVPLSSSSVISSPDPETWHRPPPSAEPWPQGRRRGVPKLQGEPLPALERSSSDECRFPVGGEAGAHPHQRREKRNTSIYKQLMDIVRKEEKQLKKAQEKEGNPDSRESSYSHRESSHSTSSDSSTSSSYSDSSSSGHTGNKNGVPANKEFDSSCYVEHRPGVPQERARVPPSLQVAFAQPYAPKKSYRPVPFDIVVNGCRMTSLRENNEVRAEVS